MGQTTSVERLWGVVDTLGERIVRLEAKHTAFDEMMDRQREVCNIERRRFDDHQGVTTKFTEHLARIDERISSIEDKLEIIRTLPWKIITGIAGVGTLIMLAGKIIVPWIKDVVK